MDGTPPAEQDAPNISVVVPTYNRRGALARLLESLEHQTLPSGDFEVAVVDDGSTDGTADRPRAQAFSYSVQVVAGEHHGPAAVWQRVAAPDDTTPSAMAMTDP